MDDLGQIPSDVAQEGVKTAKKIVHEAVKTLARAGGQALGAKPPDPGQLVAELRKQDEEFRKKAEAEILTRLQRMKAEEERLRKRREEEKKDWSLIQKEKLTPPQIERKKQLPPPAAVAKQRPETRVGWGAG